MHLGLKPAAGAVEKPKVPVPAKTVWIGVTFRRDSPDYRFQIQRRRDGVVALPAIGAASATFQNETLHLTLKHPRCQVAAILLAIRRDRMLL